MKNKYLIQIQYLGFRLHGWSKQGDLKTVHQLIDKTLSFIFDHQEFKTMGSSRTDAKVSANLSSFTLITNENLTPHAFIESLNLNLPPDIKALSIKKVEDDFNALQPNKIKEYLYLFAHNQKAHPFSAPFVTTISTELNLKLMKEACALFKGEHDFVNYVTQPKPDTKTIRTLISCEIIENTYYTANFFPTKSFALKVKSNGFMRNQVRLIMGQLFEVGKGNLTLDFIEQSLEMRLEKPLKHIAPGSGLILNSVE